jgi:predicted TIM-barrel fold metal-dependent hydrolase
MTLQAEPSVRAAEHDAPLMLFSSDSHVGPRLIEDLRDYCPKKYLKQYDEFAASEYTNPEVGLEIFLETFSDEYSNGCRRNLRTAGHHDPHARLRDMDRDGVAGSAIFHNSLNGQSFPFDLVNAFGNAAPTAAERELFGVGRSMYNRWLSDFCSIAPERTAGLAQLPFWDIEAATAELEWAAEHGLSGVNFPAPGVFGNVQPDDPSFDRFFAAAAAQDMTLATHIGSTVPTEHGNQGMPTLAHRMFLQMDSTEWGIRVVYALVFFGAFERHPNLKLVVTEVPGVIWDQMALKMDSIYHSPGLSRDNPLPRPPSEYMATNVWLGNSFQARFEAEAALDIGREDRFLWGSDYPHPEGTYTYPEDPDEYPMTRVALANTYHGLPLDKVRKIVGGNALDAYPRLDRGALHQIAAGIGPSVEELQVVPDLATYPYAVKTGTYAFRTHGPWD